ncbi:hypothetical protein [Sphingomonas oleivorans]|uniref:hypothetical protein n=1 Tax=Sphingomonas oleivorans TaxID=1735121 RepID=UPI0013FE0192|nr:hypothetical protein [Sphingomonas oleivorans]
MRYIAVTDEWAEMPLIMLTACEEDPLLSFVRESGAYCLLRKPFEANDLIGCIERTLDN